jgi:hypothetical protein
MRMAARRPKCPFPADFIDVKVQAVEVDQFDREQTAGLRASRGVNFGVAMGTAADKMEKLVLGLVERKNEILKAWLASRDSHVFEVKLRVSVHFE